MNTFAFTPYLRLIILSLIFVLGLTGIASADDPATLVGRWRIEAGQPSRNNIKNMELLSDGSGIIDEAGVGWKADSGRFYMSHSRKAQSWSYVISGATLTLIDDNGKAITYKRPEAVEAARKEAEARKAAAETAPRKTEDVRNRAEAHKAVDFIEYDNWMTWDEAKAFCLQKGRKLPQANNSESLPFGSKATRVDGFGVPDNPSYPWPSGLTSRATYWTGTKHGRDDALAIYIRKVAGVEVFGVTTEHRSKTLSVVCVPK